MSLLEKYVNDEDDSVESVSHAFSEALDNLKSHAETVVNANASFEYSVANVCLDATHCLTHLKTTMRQSTLFVENSIKKWNNYTLVYKEMLKVITMVTQPLRVIQNAQSTTSTSHAVSYLPRTNKLVTTSLFNVIQINTPLISMRYENKAIVIGVNPRPLIPKSLTKEEDDDDDDDEEEAEEEKQPFRYDPLFRYQLEELARNVIIVFEAEKHKKRIYLAHYDRLGNMRRLALHIQVVQEKLLLLTEEVNRLRLVHDQEDVDELRYSIALMSQCLVKLPEVMRETKKNCKDFVFNTIDRFTECSATYERMIREICTRGLEFEEMRSLEECQETRRPENTLFASMYC
jgi:hypothetical protein